MQKGNATKVVLTHNDSLFHKLPISYRIRVMDSLNLTQLAMRNGPIDNETWNNMRSGYRSALLEPDAVFSTVLSLAYTKMLMIAEKYKSVEKRRYAENYIQEVFGRFSTANIKYALSEGEKNNIRARINSVWANLDKEVKRG